MGGWWQACGDGGGVQRGVVRCAYWGALLVVLWCAGWGGVIGGGGGGFPVWLFPYPQYRPAGPPSFWPLAPHPTRIHPPTHPLTPPHPHPPRPQEIAGHEEMVGQYESMKSFTMPGLYRVVEVGSGAACAVLCMLWVGRGVCACCGWGKLYERAGVVTVRACVLVVWWGRG